MVLSQLEMDWTFNFQPQLSESSNIEQGKKYYVKAGEKYYRINPESGDNPSTQGWYEATQEAVDLNNYQLTIGQYNLQDPGIQSMYGDVALIVGNGADDLHRSNAVTIGKDGLVGAYIDYDTDAIRSTDSTGETESQYLTRFAIINSNNNKVTYIDAHKWGNGETLGVFGAQRVFYNSDGTSVTKQNQFGLGIKNDQSLFVFMSDPAKAAWKDVLGISNISNSSISVTGNIVGGQWAKNTARSSEYMISLGGGAGRIYLYSQGAITGNRGIYGVNAAGAGAAVLTVNQSNAVAVNTSSDKELKKNINILSNKADQLILSLKPVSFEWKTDSGINIGFIAQDVEDSMNKIGINSNDYKFIAKPGINGDYYTLNYTEFIPMIVHLCQTQQKEIDELKQEIQALKEKDL